MGLNAALVSESGQRGDGNGLYQVNSIGNADPSRFEDMGGEQGDEDIVGICCRTGRRCRRMKRLLRAIRLRK